MKPPLEILFVSCSDEAEASILCELEKAYEPEFVAVATRKDMRRELRSSEWNLIFATTESDLPPGVILAERALAGRETPIFVLCDASNEESALEAVRIGAGEAIRLDELRRLLPAVARELRTTNLRYAHPAGGRGESELQWATSALLHLARTRTFLGDNLFDDLREITEVAGSALSVARASVWLNDPARSKIRCIDLFDQRTGKHTDGMELFIKEHPAYFLTMEQQRLIVAHDARNDPRTREYRDNYLVPLGITSMMDAAVRSKGELRGVVCLEHVGPPRMWTAEEELFTAALADLVSLAMEAGERHGIEQTLRETELHFLELFEHTSDAVLIVGMRNNGEWVCETMNPACEETTGLRMVDVSGKNVCSLLSSGTPEVLLRAFLACQTGREIVTREHPLDLPTGQRWFNTVLVPLPDSQGGIRRIAIIARDITEHRLTEDRLRASEQRRILHIQKTPLGAIEWSLDGRVVSWNPAAEKIFGFSAHEAIGQYFTFTIPVDVRPHVEGVWNALVVQKGGMRSNNRNLRKDGTIIECEWYNTPLIDEAGRTIGVASLVQDITEKLQNEEAIRRLNANLEKRVHERTAQLAAANQELEAFCYSVSHDLRAPLRSIDGFSLALLEDCHDLLNADGQDYLRRVRAASQRMGELIDDLLNLSRVSRAELHSTRVDLSSLARKIADGLHTTNPERRVEWVIAPSLIAQGDRNLMTILLENLLGNAHKYTSRHERARIEVGGLSDEGRMVYFVKDDGAGFDEAYADKLFKPFQRLHRPDEFDGHGIGLATVNRIIRRHGGQIWANGEVERGAAFYFTLDSAKSGGDSFE
ncbi:MAG: PAS domain S-box protein [Planctomycetes bacterium]|nr:PAS domain S-box protein [Planctomycetota bacterium]